MTSILDGRRLVIAHNPHSSRALAVQEQVFDRLTAAGYSYERIEVQQASLEDNVARLAPQIQPGDLILSAAGDGSAHAVFHSVMAANQPGVELGFLAYGNFNDIPNTFNSKKSLRDPVVFLEQAKQETIKPITVYVDGNLLRSALLYATIGWTARAAGVFNEPKVRYKIKHGGAGIVKSLWRTGGYYFQSRRTSALPPFSIGGVHYRGMTDIIAANGPTVARLFRSGKRYYKQPVFLFRVLNVRSIIHNVPFLLAGLIGRMRGQEVESIAALFDAPANVTLQCDGEVVELEGCTSIEIKKADRPLLALTSKSTTE